MSITGITRRGIEFRFTIDEPFEVEGVGAWSSYGHKRRYLATGIVVTLGGENAVTLAFTSSRRSSTFTSEDPRLIELAHVAIEYALQAVAHGL